MEHNITEIIEQFALKIVFITMQIAQRWLKVAYFGETESSEIH